ncbi:unnamed protein product [Chilo suppressalis]|uniref:Aminopeptidase n=1 Tax=Chilo suppressalis TaxID=168631 RepID=A0ABN8BH36_CHISP|nr:unnamed protein product [Chilo suppressalis]
MVRAMLGSERVWRAAASFCESVMAQKEAAEREREEDALAAPLRRRRVGRRRQAAVTAVPPLIATSTERSGMSFHTIALSLMLLVLAKADFPLDFINEFEDAPSEFTGIRSDERIYRLPENVIPLDYDIYLDMYFSERTDNPFTYDGREYIIIQAVEENVTQIVLHANVDSINDVTLQTQTGDQVAISRFYTEAQYHFLKIDLETSLIQNNNYSLYINYSSTMNDGPMKRGIWRGWYVDDDGVERVYATTHFQPYNARQAFPCWDEPLFKATFTLHLTRPYSYSSTFSNTAIKSSDLLEGGRFMDTFQPSPVMSSYLVTFLVSETFQIIAQDRSLNPAIRIIGRSNTAGLGGPALNMAVQMTKHFDEYFGIPYSSLHPYLLNDHIASPDWASAGTENWGMVSYRELHLILDSQVTIMSVEHYAATLVSHELAHKWFGNLITCFWWSNTWINEGYASYFGYMATHQVFPQYELHEHFNSRYLQTSLAFDSGTGTVPLNHDVNTPAQVTGHFGTISYSKAAAFLRMTANMISQESFKKSCQYFLKNNLYQATDQYDLFQAFDEAVREDGTLQEYLHFNFTEYYDIWVNQPGYPTLIVYVDHATGEMALRQERFFLSSSAETTGQTYPIPLTYSTKRNRNFDELKPSDMMSSERMVLLKPTGEEWVIFNHQQHGHYRVTYDDRTWSLNTEALENERDSIHHLNRAQVVDDVFALMRSERMTHEKGFSILRFLRKEDNYHVWNPAISGFTWLRNRLRHLPERQAEFDSIILSYMEHVINKVGYEPESEETPTVSMLRQEVLQFACNLGHEECVQESVRRFLDMKENNAVVDRRIRRSVYMNGVREGGVEDFEFILDRFSKSNIANDRLEMLRALGTAKDPQLLTRYLQLTLTRDVRSHDKVNSFNFALLGHQDNANTVLEFVKNHIDDIRIEYVEDAPPTPVHTALSNLASYLDESGLNDYEAWLRSTQSGSAQFNRVLTSIASARSSIAWGTANADSILSAARGGATSMAVSVALLVISIVLFTAV